MRIHSDKCTMSRLFQPFARLLSADRRPREDYGDHINLSLVQKGASEPQRQFRLAKPPSCFSRRCKAAVRRGRKLLTAWDGKLLLAWDSELRLHRIQTGLRRGRSFGLWGCG